MNHNFSLLALANILYSIQNGLQIDQALCEAMLAWWENIWLQLGF